MQPLLNSWYAPVNLSGAPEPVEIERPEVTREQLDEGWARHVAEVNADRQSRPVKARKAVTRIFRMASGSSMMP